MQWMSLHEEYLNGTSLNWALYKMFNSCLHLGKVWDIRGMHFPQLNSTLAVFWCRWVRACAGARTLFSTHQPSGILESLFHIDSSSLYQRHRGDSNECFKDILKRISIFTNVKKSYSFHINHKDRLKIDKADSLFRLIRDCHTLKVNTGLCSEMSTSYNRCFIYYL